MVEQTPARRPGGDTAAVGRLARPMSPATIPPPPAAVRWARRVLLAGAVVQLVRPLGLLGVDLAAYARLVDPTGSLDAAADRLALLSVVLLVVWSLLTAAVWWLHAWMLLRGRAWVRVSWSFVALAVVAIETQEIQGWFSVVQLVVSLATICLAIGAVVLLWSRPVGEWLRAADRAGRG